MASKLSGHKGGLPLTRVLSLVDRYAYKQRHAAWNWVGVKRGLPPDVVTVQVGKPEDGLWWNLKKGMIPEHSIQQAGAVVDNEDVLELMHKYGMNPLAQAARQGIAKHQGAMSMFNERTFKHQKPARLLYIGWRPALRSMLSELAIRPNGEIEALLGRKDYEKAMETRRYQLTVNYGYDSMYA